MWALFNDNTQNPMVLTWFVSRKQAALDPPQHKPIWVPNFPENFAENTLALPEPCWMWWVQTDLSRAAPVLLTWANTRWREAKAIRAFNYFWQATDRWAEEKKNEEKMTPSSGRALQPVSCFYSMQTPKTCKDIKAFHNNILDCRGKNNSHSTSIHWA